MYDGHTKIKFKISNSLKGLNQRYHRNYTLQDIAEKIGISRETLSRMTSSSPFNLVYSVTSCLYEFYPEYNNGEWDFSYYANLLAWDDLSFML